MANNPYVNKVEKADGTVIMDISDSTATENDVLPGKTFYKANGQRSTGSLTNATQSTDGLMSAEDKTKLDGIAAGATANVGTITGITMNGTSKGTSGVVNLGTVITAHQDISGKVSGPNSATNNAVAIFDGTGGKTIKNSGFTIEKSIPSNAVFTDTTYSAGSGLALSGTTFRVDVPRVAESANHLPGINSFQLREYTSGANYNLPSNAFYHIYEAKGSDGGYGTQLALGMTTQKAYYRRYSNGSWTDWERILFATDIIDNLTSTNTDKSLSANQGKVLNELVANKANGKQATWLPSNGYNPYTSETGYFCYAVNPNLMVSQGSPTGLNSYATVFGDCSGTYKKMFYSDVYGRLAIWNSQESAWKKIAATTDIPAVINNLTSTSTTDALSANQGKVLNDKITEATTTEDYSSELVRGVTGITVNDGFLKKYGNVITMSCSVSNSSTTTAKTIAAYTPIVKFPSSIGKPSQHIFCIGRGSDNNVYDFYVSKYNVDGDTTKGQVLFAAALTIPAGGWIKFGTTWIV